ncbi:SPW repeat domain-containing protein [Actinophytocola gossypii]|uniref:SPW repeat protein n=1 Tax=Actinophytocola gossypii TaxID=2812003 RepID=A0ABT2J967_9PSEU|nr:hypothetical protein [Actinophytocola gossypii]MCT2584406.1 SPW repeat protein [Actinophytocola gossypii]
MTPSDTRPGLRDRLYPVVTAGLLIAGVWLLLAPFLWNYDATGAGSSALWNDLTIGVAVVLIGLTRFVGAINQVYTSFVGVLLGAWTTIAPFALRYRLTPEYPTATLNDVLVGVLVTALALIGLATAGSDR